jgi:twinkle protein
MTQVYDINKYSNTHKPQSVPFPQRGVFAELPERGIRKDAAAKFGVELLYSEEGTPIARSYPNYDKNGNFVAQKIKKLSEKRMKWLGDTSNTSFFGQNVFPPGGKYITVTEGEEDCLAAWQMLSDNLKGSFDPAVVSLTDGAGSAEKDCKRHWEYLNSFDNIVLCFDGDTPGKEAANKVAQLFPGKVRIVHFPNTVKNKDGEWEWKDACDYLRNGKHREFVNMWYKAEKYAPKGVRTFSSLWDDMIKKENSIVVPFPWDGLNKYVHGAITGKMDVWKAPPKVGKTSVLSEIIMHIREVSPYNVGVIFLESTAKEIGLKLCGIKANLPLDRPGVEMDLEQLKEIHDEISENDRILVFDPQDERTVENVFNKIVYFVKAHDCRFIFLDHASMLAYTSEDQNERKFLDKLFAELKQLTTSINIYLGVVIHVNDDGQTRGSRAPVQLCDRLYALNRDKLNTDEVISNTTEIIVEENRFGSSGLATRVFYDQTTGRISELDPETFLEKQNKANSREVKFDD